MPGVCASTGVLSGVSIRWEKSESFVVVIACRRHLKHVICPLLCLP